MNCDNLRPPARELNEHGQRGDEKIKRYHCHLFLERNRSGKEADGKRQERDYRFCTIVTVLRN